MKSIPFVRGLAALALVFSIQAEARGKSKIVSEVEAEMEKMEQLKQELESTVIQKVEVPPEIQALLTSSEKKTTEELTPYLAQVREWHAEGDYNAVVDFCDEVIKRSPAGIEPFEELRTKAKKSLHRLARDAYLSGNLLEGLKLIPQAKQYWERARNYVRPGDELFDAVEARRARYDGIY